MQALNVTYPPIDQIIVTQLDSCISFTIASVKYTIWWPDVMFIFKSRHEA